jgi:hypothetical protein
MFKCKQLFSLKSVLLRENTNFEMNSNYNQNNSNSNEINNFENQYEVGL